MLCSLFSEFQHQAKINQANKITYFFFFSVSFLASVKIPLVILASYIKLSIRSLSPENNKL